MFVEITTTSSTTSFIDPYKIGFIFALAKEVSSRTTLAKPTTFGAKMGKHLGNDL